MIKSMTGFASLTHEDERATIAVTVRAVNHRFLDLQLRVPHAFGDVEPRLRTLLQKRLARGRVEVGISVQVRDLSECLQAALHDALFFLEGECARVLVQVAVVPDLVPGGENRID